VVRPKGLSGSSLHRLHSLEHLDSEKQLTALAALASNMAAAHSHSAHATNAMECCEVALRFRPGHPKALFQRAKLLMQLNHLGPAVKDLHQVLAAIDGAPQLVLEAQRCLDYIKQRAGSGMPADGIY